MPRIYTLEETLIIGQKACQYASRQILHGCTDLKNNELEFEYYRSHVFGIVHLRSRVNKEVKIAQNIDALFLPLMLREYDNRVLMSSKYSLGNCHELAYQALDYILQNEAEDLNADVFKISGGDHVFVVLNKDPKSDCQNPGKWGPGAVICDPWAKKVFPAQDYLSKLKNYKGKNFFISVAELVNGKSWNRIEDFNPSKHRLDFLIIDGSPCTVSNIRAMRKDQKIIKTKFATMLNNFKSCLNEYKCCLEKEKNRLQARYGANDFKAAIILNKIPVIERLIRQIEDNEILIQSQYANASEAIEEFKRKLTDLFHNFINAEFTKDEKDKLFSYREDDPATSAMKIFGLHSRTESNLGAAIKKMDSYTAALDFMSRKR